VAGACRADGPATQDLIVGGLLRRFNGDKLAQLTLVAGLSAGLGSVLSGWARAAVVADELINMEAELVSECWSAAADLALGVADGQPVPDRVGLRLVDGAREAVRVPRRRHRRQSERQVSFDRADPPARADRPGCEALAGEIAGAVRSGRLAPWEARPVFLTRVAGFDVAETAALLGCSPGTVRAVRSRAERRLIAAA
jgi:hypothetical protein